MKRKKRKPLTEKQKQAAQFCFDGYRFGQIAEMVGVHRCTIWRWYKRSDFQREIARITDRWQREYRKRMMKEIRESPEYKLRKAAKRKLKYLEKKMEKAGNSGDMIAYERISKEYDRCFNLAYFNGKTPAEVLSLSQFYSAPKKARKPKKYIITFID